MAKRQFEWGDYNITVFGKGDAYRYVIEDPEHPGYQTSIRLRWDPDGPSVVGVEVLAGKGATVSPRDVKRLPLSTYVRAAVLHGDPRTQDVRHGYAAAVEALRAPRGRPQRGRSIGFYREFADFYRDIATHHPYPAKEIARRKKGVDVNTVYQWVYRARELGLLERPPRRKGEE